MAETPLVSEAPPKISRREFLNLAWLASLGFLLVDIGGITYLFAMPPFKEGEFGGKFAFGTPFELPTVGGSPQNLPKLRFWLSNTEKGIIALYKVCTHLGCIYNWSDQEEKFICPCHGSQFQADGTYIRGPAPRSLDRFVIQLVDSGSDQVIAETDPEGNPLPLPQDPNLIIRIDTGRRILGKPH